MAGQTKNAQNYISATYPDGHTEILFAPLAPFETPEALDRICEEYNKVIGNMELEPFIAIPVFIHDFLCIHPFNDGNGRMSRLLTTLLLYRSGFYVGKYISLEAKIAKSKDLYYDALLRAQHGWHEGTEDVDAAQTIQRPSTPHLSVHSYNCKSAAVALLILCRQSESTQAGAFSFAFEYTTKNKDNGMVIDVIAGISSIFICILCVKIEPCQPLYRVWS